MVTNFLKKIKAPVLELYTVFLNSKIMVLSHPCYKNLKLTNFYLQLKENKHIVGSKYFSHNLLPISIIFEIVFRIYTIV